MPELVRDIRLTVRGWARQPLFVLVAVLTLALGIGANTALFTLADAVLLRSLPVRSPQDLVVVGARDPGGFEGSFSYPMYRALRDGNTVFSGVIARAGTDFSVSAAGTAEHVYGEFVTGNYYQTLGVKPYLGRLLTPDDDRVAGGHPVAVLSYGFWRTALGGDRSIAGKEILLNGRRMTVLGVTPPGFYGTETGANPAIAVPMMMAAVFELPANRLSSWGHRWITLLARLTPGISASRARAASDVICHQAVAGELARQTPSAAERMRKGLGTWRIELHPGAQGFGRMQRMLAVPMRILLGVTTLVLLITCVNLAHLLLARAAQRQQEVGVRIALGASRGRLIRQFLTESSVLALSGGCAGILAAFWMLPALLRFLPATTSVGRDLQPDLAAMGFAMGLSLVTGLIFGLAPAVQATRAGIAQAMKRDSQNARQGRLFNLRQALIVAQIALSVVLLVGAGLLLSTLRNLRGIDTGFERTHILLASIAPRLSNYSPERTLALAANLVERVEHLPGVRSASMGEVGLLSGAWDSDSIVVEGYPPSEGDKEGPQVNTVSPGYFRTLGIPFVAGRDFAANDNAGSGKVAVVNETMARHYFPQGNAIGKRFGFGEPGSQPDIEIVGVVKDSRYVNLRETTPRFVYVPVAQREPFSLTLHVQTTRDPLELAAMVRGVVRSLDPNLPVYDVTTLATQVDNSISRERLMASLTTWFGGLATLLAAVGIYGILAFAVARRTREIGIRMALGAETGDVLALVMRQTAVIVGSGLALGIVAAAAMGRLLASVLYGVKSLDPLVLAGSCALLASIALAASYLPARRAALTDPLAALRHE